MSVKDDAVKILFADSILDLLAARVVEHLAAKGGCLAQAGGVQVRMESGRDWVSSRVACAELGRSKSWLDRFVKRHPDVKRNARQDHQKVGRPMFSLRRINAILEDSNNQ